MGAMGAVTRRTVILAGRPRYAGVVMAETVVPAVVRSSDLVRGAFADAVGCRFEAASEIGCYELTLASVEDLATGGAKSGSLFGLMFSVAQPPLPSGVYRLSPVANTALPDAQLFVESSAKPRSRSRRLTGRHS